MLYFGREVNPIPYCSNLRPLLLILCYFQLGNIGTLDSIGLRKKVLLLPFLLAGLGITESDSVKAAVLTIVVIL